MFKASLLTFFLILVCGCQEFLDSSYAALNGANQAVVSTYTQCFAVVIDDTCVYSAYYECHSSWTRCCDTLNNVCWDVQGSYYESVPVSK